jgi:hypothetical protein
VVCEDLRRWSTRVQAIEAAAGDAPRLGPFIEHWLAHRNTVPSWDFFLDRELMVDTIRSPPRGTMARLTTRCWRMLRAVLAWSSRAHTPHFTRRAEHRSRSCQAPAIAPEDVYPGLGR